MDLKCNPWSSVALEALQSRCCRALRCKHWAYYWVLCFKKFNVNVSNKSLATRLASFAALVSESSLHSVLTDSSLTPHSLQPSVRIIISKSYPNLFLSVIEAFHWLSLSKAFVWLRSVRHGLRRDSGRELPPVIVGVEVCVRVVPLTAHLPVHR